MEVQPITLVYCFKLREKYFKITAFFPEEKRTVRGLETVFFYSPYFARQQGWRHCVRFVILLPSEKDFNFRLMRGMRFCASWNER